MTAFARYMPQVATYWAPGVNDGFGGVGFANPILINCRWQDQPVLFRDASGREVTSSAVVYPDRRLEIRGYLSLGDMAAAGSGAGGSLGPRGVSGAREIRQCGVSPSLSADEYLNKVWL